MTIDVTPNSQGGRVSDLEMDMSRSDFDVATIQLAAADAVRVELPRGQRIVVVPVTPGERIQLPTDTEQGLLAELGPNGNLAFVIDGRTIILQGYAAANEETPVTIVTNDGETVDVAAVIAETDPSIEIQTAAGAAAGSQGDTAGGGGIFVPFPAGTPLGGFSSAGVLGPTALSYKLITDDSKVFDLDDDDDDERGGEIENSLPEANPDSVTVAQALATDYQLMLVIDVSGSMAREVIQPDGTVTTRLELQKAAAIGLLESYAGATAGSVKVKMVQFTKDASYFGGTGPATFVDITDPANLAAVIAAIDALSPRFATDYDAALATAQQGIMDPSWVATDATSKGLVYFFSDGLPENENPPDATSSYPGGSKSNALDQIEEDIWEGRIAAPGFASGLAAKGVVSIAVGLGAQVTADPDALAQLGRVAYHSEAFSDQPVIVVSDENQLIAEIIETVPATVTGNVLANDDPGSDGYGAPAIISVSAVIDGDTTTQLVTDTATGYKVETNNGILTVDKTTGAFSYTAVPGSGGNEDTFTYAIQDGSPGDTANATLTVTITPPTIVTGTAPFDGTAVQDFIIGDDADNVISAAGGIDSVQGGFGNDKLDGGAGNDALFGQEGRDTLLGGAGSDRLLGGNGDDLLDGGDDSDADVLSGGNGDDTLLWRGAGDTYDGGADLFNAATGAAGDVLDASGEASIDFTAIEDGRIEDIETIRVNGGSGTLVTLDAADVIGDLEGSILDPGGAGSGGAFGSAPLLRVDGDAGDALDLAGGNWHEATGSGGVPAGHTLYVHESGGASPGASEDAYVLAQNGVTVTGV